LRQQLKRLENCAHRDDGRLTVKSQLIAIVAAVLLAPTGFADPNLKDLDKPVPVHDLNATILHQLGIHHEQLTYRFQGRDYRLTDLAGNVVHDILA
jgi:hypothetical protein